MNLKRGVAYLTCLILLFSVIGSGCSEKVGEPAGNIDQAANEQVPENETAQDELSQDEASPEEQLEDGASPDAQSEENTASEAEETSEEQVSESNSPWKLISESSVETKVNYAGFLNESIGVTVGYSGATSYTEDGGKTWSKSGNVSYCRYGLDLLNESFIVDSGNGGENLISRDKGSSWAHMTSFPLKDGAFNRFLSAVDEKNIYIGAIKTLGVSNDGGNHWKELELPEGCTKVTGMFFLTPEIGYLLNTDGTLFKTNDACATWTSTKIDMAGEKFVNSSVPPAAISFQDENHGMIVYSTKSIKVCCIKTEDGGSTWEPVEMPAVTSFNPYLSRDGQYLTLSSPTRKISLYKLEIK